MATPPSGSRSQPPITTPAFNFFFHHCYSHLKPWSELIDRNSLSRPGSLFEAYSRLHHNLSYFHFNYVTVTAITLALSLLTHPFSLIILCLLSYAIILCLFHPSGQPLILFGRTFSNSEIHGLLVIFTLYLTTSVGTLLISVLMVGFVVVCAHGACRVLPEEDLFLDAYDQEPRDAEFNTNLISVPDAEFNTNLVSEPNVISSSSPPTKYDVFLSFRGKDTRHSFTSHLYAELCRKNIQTYIDDKLDRGENISPALQTAIKESMIYVVIFSENYASSRWCLDELKSILECKERYGRTVIPIFYDVDPYVIRHQRGSYGYAFAKHEGRYKDKVVQGWKAALTNAAGLSGWNSKEIRPEYAFVREIAKDILKKLNSNYSSDYQGLIGIHKHVAQIQSLLHVESAAVRIIGIWGIGGIGKTTIAGAIYHKLASQFSSCSVIMDFQEEMKRYGRMKYDGDYLPRLLYEKHDIDLTESFNQNFNRMKILLILDNVNNSVQLNDLIGGHGSFGPGSRIIVISRDQQVLKNAGADEIYEVKEMNFQDSLQLFSLNAFKQSYPLEAYMDVAEKVLNYAKGSPLALKVLGLLLYGRTREEWESELQKLEKHPNLETFNVLKLSYDGLDDEQKDIFLDIACFYRGHDMNTVKQVLDDCGFSAAIGMRILVDRGLISIFNGVIVMHNLIQEMGQEIVCQQCVNEPGKRSRLWKPNDIYQVLKKNKGTDAIQCIFLDISKIEKVQLHDETFKMMHNLRLLQFCKSTSREDSKVYIPEFLESLPDELRFLRWDDFPQRSLPINFSPENLVKLDMRDSRLEKLWDTDQHLPNLRRIDLSGSQKLIQIPDLSQSPNIEEIILSHCANLIQVYSSTILRKLSCLILYGCSVLKSLYISTNIMSGSSGLIVLCGCWQLDTFSVSDITEGVLICGHSSGKLLTVTEEVKKKEERKYDGVIFESPTNSGKSLSAKGEAKKCESYWYDRVIVRSPSNTFDPIVSSDLYEENMPLNFEVLRKGLFPTFSSLRELCWLDLSNCRSLTSLPIFSCKLKFLKRLILRGCSNLENFPEIEEIMENLAVLILDKTAIKELPLSLCHLVGLQELSLHMCQMLEIIPSSIGNLNKLFKLDLTYCESLETIPSSIFKLKLTKLDLQGCSMLRAIPEIMELPNYFELINLTKTAIKEIPSSLEHLDGLRILRLKFCRDLEFLPDSIVNIMNLTDLDCSGCCKLAKVPNDIGRLSSLSDLSLCGTYILMLPESIAQLSSLKSLDISDCIRLECIPELPPSLKQLLAFDCPNIKTVMSSSKFKLPSDSKEGIFKFHFTNSQEVDPSAHINIVADAWLMITQATYRSVFYCFPGNAVPQWFPYRCKGRAVTLTKVSLNCCNDKRFIGFALCVVLGVEALGEEPHLQPLTMKNVAGEHSIFRCNLIFQCDDGTHYLPGHDDLKSYFIWKGQHRFIFQDHTFIWNCYLDYTTISHVLSHAYSLTLEIGKRWSRAPPSKFDNTTYSVKIKECGIRPLFTKGNYDDGQMM